MKKSSFLAGLASVVFLSASLLATPVKAHGHHGHHGHGGHHGHSGHHGSHHHHGSGGCKWRDIRIGNRWASQSNCAGPWHTVRYY